MPVILPTDLHQPPAQHQVVSQVARTSATDRSAAKATPKRPARTLRTITVRAGDTIYGVARRQHASVTAIIKANPGLDAGRLVAGTTLHVPVSTPTERPHAAPRPATPVQYAPKPEHVITYAGTAAAHGYPAAQVASGDAHRRQLARENLPTADQLRSMIVATAKRYGVSPRLALGIGMEESGFSQSAVSVCDAIGTMQVMPETGEWASGIVGKRLDITHAQDNITAGVTTLRYLTTHARDEDEVIGSYYQGLGAMQQHGPYSDTKHYIASVKGYMTQFSDH